MGKNTDFTGIAILLALGYAIYRLEFKKANGILPSVPTIPTLPSLPPGFFSFLGSIFPRVGQVPTPYQPAPYYPPYVPPPALTLTEEQEEQLGRVPHKIPDLHKALKETTGKAARFIIERKIAPAPPKISQVKDLHKEMTALKTQTAIWIAERPELWGGETGR